MDEFSIDAPSEVDAGQATWSVRNAGTIEHQFTLISTDLSQDELPVVDAQVVLDGLDVIGEVETLEGGGSAAIPLDVDPGPNVLICNVAGHYQSGMRTALDAS